MLSVFLWAIALAIIIVTLLPLTNSVKWWVRMWDFSRLHVAILALVVLIAALSFDVSFNFSMIASMFAVLVYQSILIFPYTPFAGTEVDLIEAPSANVQVKMLSVNVLMENARYDDLVRIIDRENPDVLFLMETDEVWHDALATVLDRYPTTKTHLTDDHYGLIFATRLDADSTDLLWPYGDNTPALKAVMHAPEGTTFNFIGLHPRPPVPGNDTAVRDQQIKNAALMTASTDRPTVCMGDFNDVAWSWTTRRFKRYGNFLEPRVGRGLISSFHAKYPLMRLPIDQLFLTKDVRLVSFDRLEYFGSDHFPISATVFFENAKEQSNGD